MSTVKASIPLPLDQIRAICRKYGVAELAVFGSVLRDDFGPDSDVDFLVTFRPDTDFGPWMTRFFELQDELAAALGRPVDLVDRKAIEASENYIRKAAILRSAEALYVEG